ncbi:type II 3-dehydroquinate dehydratase [Emticicia sp. BO119]|uniref:type II 3-dehydroquinate dehydratase n=1 Tax=Emticicia sp. BO119 TaxID=2757768 RepID=UPI0015F02FBC|nr:type II 3-dehydroquinate dehydratase [Emticicia sp. BO119]MBA4848828.1 type II 3-dehydroquinate dehydratase [Emticicia sp. BO119]
MKKIIIINGPNLNLLGRREPHIYGSQTFEDYLAELKEMFSTIDLHYYQSNHEGGIIDKIHEIGYGSVEFDGLIINAGAYTHTSIAIADALSAIKTPAIEVHISNIHAREAFRHHSYLTSRCKGMICGLGMKGYEMAIRYFI